MINGIILNDQLYIDVACYSLGIHFHTCMPELYLISQLMSLSIVMPQYPPISALFLHMYVYFLEMRIFCI
jgi:hypothetical protein